MIRIVAQASSWGAAANVGGPVHTEVRTFDIECPELEAWLDHNVGAYGWSGVIGAEVRPDREEFVDAS